MASLFRSRTATALWLSDAVIACPVPGESPSDSEPLRTKVQRRSEGSIPTLVPSTEPVNALSFAIRVSEIRAGTGSFGDGLASKMRCHHSVEPEACGPQELEGT
jgi:hypothetical protein